MTRELRCKVSKGMFSDERIVTVPSRPEEVSAFVHIGSVHENNGSSTVSVRIIDQNGHLYAVLPSEDQQIVAIAQADLR